MRPDLPQLVGWVNTRFRATVYEDAYSPFCLIAGNNGDADAIYDPVLATLALIAGLYHTINHALFKALLFLGAGAVLHATHTRNMEEMGGLIKRMPQTAFFFLMGAIAISALPPLNGFVSEWLTYQSLLQGFGTTPSLIRLMFPLSGAMLALTGALAAACFVKAFGITFLAQPRSEHARNAHEASFTMLLGQGILTAACVFLGLFPTVVLKLFDPLTRQLTGEELSRGLEKIKSLRKRYTNISIEDKSSVYNTNLYHALELGNLLDLAEVMVTGALRRTESRGGHARRDYPERDDANWLKHTLAFRTDEGPKLDYKPVTITTWQPVERKY